MFTDNRGLPISREEYLASTRYARSGPERPSKVAVARKAPKGLLLAFAGWTVLVLALTAYATDAFAQPMLNAPQGVPQPQPPAPQGLPPMDDQQQVCAPYEAIVGQLKARYGEEPSHIGFNDGGLFVTVWLDNAETGTWTLLQVTPDHMACMISSGAGSQTPPRGEPA
jgi:hypothetical protein